MICPHCGQQHPPSACFCPITGRPLTVAPPPPPPPLPQQPRPSLSQPPLSQAPLSQLPLSQPPLSQPPPRKKVPVWVIVAIVLALGLVLLLACGIFWLLPRLNLDGATGQVVTPSQGVVLTLSVPITESGPTPQPPRTISATPQPQNPNNPPGGVTPVVVTWQPITITPTSTPTSTRTPGPTPLPHCPQVTWRPRVKVGDTVKVCTIYRLRVRDDVDGEDIIFLLPMTNGTTTLEIMGGPYCGEDAWWWRVRVPANSMYNRANTNPGAPIMYTTDEITGYVKEGLDPELLPDSQGYYLCVQPKK